MKFLAISYFSFQIALLLLGMSRQLLLNRKGEPVKGVDPERIPGVNINVEYTDNDPANTRRYDSERRSTTERIIELEIQLNSEKSKLQQIVAMQSAKINEITEIAKSTYSILDSITSKTYANPNFYFNQDKK